MCISKVFVSHALINKVGEACGRCKIEIMGHPSSSRLKEQYFSTEETLQALIQMTFLLEILYLLVSDTSAGL